MEISLERDPAHRLICELTEGTSTATVTASDVPEAGEALMAALEDARDAGYGECLWREQGGDYRWMFRLGNGRLTVVVLWSSGVITGWQHVFRSECELDWLVDRVRADLAWHQVSPRPGS